MKLSRILAAGAAAALVAVSALAIGGSAVAADSYVQDTDFGAVADGDPYLPGWFTGDVGAAPGTFESTTSGLSFVGPFQILNGTPGTGDLTDLVDGADLGVVSGEIAFQIPIFTDGPGETGFTTLVPEVPGNTGLHTTAAMWGITDDITMADGTVVLDADDLHTLVDIEAALDSLDTTYEVLAFGAYLPLTKSAVVSHITWNGNTHWFLPAAPTATITPASLTVDDFSTDGISMTFTGYVPGEDVVLGISAPNSGGILDTVVADTNGNVAYTYVYSGEAAVGTYTIQATGETSGVVSVGSFAVTANPAELAETGADFTPEIIAGSLLLLVGGGFVVAARRRAIAKRH